MKVKTNGNRPASPPAPTNYDSVKGQGRIPYGKEVPVSMPSASTGREKTGMKRGTGAALRGKEYRSA